MAKKKKEKRIRGVMCYWEYVPPKPEERAYATVWKLVHTVPHDDDGYPVGSDLPDFINNCSDHRHVWTCWMHTDNPDDDGYDDNREPIMGRAVTAWNVEDGVSLVDLHPPAWVDWLATGFVEELRKNRNWTQIIEGGHTLYLGTARAAEKVLDGE